jgi:hypothetical protein
LPRDFFLLTEDLAILNTGQFDRFFILTAYHIYLFNPHYF